MKYDEIDDFVNQLFTDGQRPNEGDVLRGEVLSGDWRIERIDNIIQDAYQEAIWWHNERIAAGACRNCGLTHTGGCMAFDEEGYMDIVTQTPSTDDSSIKRNGDPRVEKAAKEEREAVRRKQLENMRARLIAGRYQAVYVGGEWVLVGEVTDAQLGRLAGGQSNGLTCGDILLISAVGFFIIVFMMLWS